MNATQRTEIQFPNKMQIKSITEVKQAKLCNPDTTLEQFLDQQ